MDAYLGLMLVLEMEENEEQVERPLRRNRYNAWELEDHKFMAMFRVSKALARNLVHDLSPSLPRRSRISAIPDDLRVLMSLRFFATGSYQLAVATDCTVSVCQATVCNCIKQVCSAIQARLARQWVKFPKTPADQNAVKRGFWTKYDFPGVLGAVDGTHVAIVPPPVNDPEFPEHAYVNRKNFHSINVQLVCDANKNILALSAKYPGRSHDAFIWRNSSARRYLSGEFNNGNTTSWVLGDSGYPLEPWLMTPFEEPRHDSPEGHYNRVHAKARAVVECTIGMLKQRWRCLLKDRVLHYRPTAASRIINSCAVLHNICMHHNMPILDEDVPNPLEEEIENVNDGERRGNRLATVGQRVRHQIVRRLGQNRRAVE